MQPPERFTQEVARIHGPGDVRMSREPIPEPRPGEVLLRITAVGLCGSDLHWFEEGQIGDAALGQPLVLGHEIGGVVASGPRTGTRVLVDPVDNCGRCGPCLDGRSHLCLSIRFAGHGSTDGALRSFMAWPDRLAIEVPDTVEDDVVPLLEPLAVAVHAVGLAGTVTARRAGVYGSGPIGLLLIGLLRRRGCDEIVATDTLEHRVAAAASFGASSVFHVDELSGPESGMSDGRRAAREMPVDVAFETAGSDEALADAIAAVRPGGTVVIVGIPKGDRTSFAAAAARRKELTFVESRRSMPVDLAQAIELAATGSINVAAVVSHRYRLADAPAAFAALAERRGNKVLVRPDGA